MARQAQTAQVHDWLARKPRSCPWSFVGLAQKKNGEFGVEIFVCVLGVEMYIYIYAMTHS